MSKLKWSGFFTILGLGYFFIEVDPSDIANSQIEQAFFVLLLSLLLSIIITAFDIRTNKSNSSLSFFLIILQILLFSSASFLYWFGSNI
jgi:hypothetical protein